MPVLDRLFGRTRSGTAPAQGFSGVVRLGTAYYNAKWNFTRVLNEVYANPTGYRCINTITDDFSRPPWAIYSDASPNQPVDDAKATELLSVLNKPSEKLSGTGMQRHIAMDLELNGRSLWLQLRGKDQWGDRGPLTGLKRLACENVTVITNDDRDLLGFIYTTDTGTRIPLLPGEVIYLHYAHPQNPWEGFPPAYIAGLPANVDDRAMRFNWRLLENDGALPGYITVEGLEASEFREFKAIWDAGADPGKVRFLKGGSTSFTKVGQSNKDMLYDSLRATSQDDMFRAFGMSRLVVDPTDATFANGNVARMGYITTKINSMWSLVADQFTTQIQDDYPTYRIGFDLSDIEELGEAKDDVVNRAIMLWESGLISDEESREMIGFGPKSDAIGDFFAPTPALPAGSEPDQSSNTDPIDQAAQEKWVKASSADEEHTGICVAFWLDDADARAMAVEGCEPPDQLHMTLAYLGKTTDETIDREALESTLKDFAGTHDAVSAWIAGEGVFHTPNDGDAIVALIDAPGLPTWRQDLVVALEAAGLPVSNDHGFTPHITLAYVEPGEDLDIAIPADYKLNWDTFTLAWGSERITFKLSGGDTKALSKQKAIDWNDFDHKVQAYETKAARKMKRFFDKQSRVIAATIRSRRGKSLHKALDGYFDRARWDAELADEAGDMFSDVIDSFGTWTMANLPTATKFDATHERVTEYIQGRSTQAAGLVNDTTEAQLRASIDALEAQGLGVDDIAKGVEDYFETNGASRAELWARTECIGASNFSALEAARQSDVVTGKSWLTAAGADEDCISLEAIGAIDLDDDFDGTDAPPRHPNCRCTILLLADDGGTEDADE